MLSPDKTHERTQRRGAARPRRSRASPPTASAGAPFSLSRAGTHIRSDSCRFSFLPIFSSRTSIVSRGRGGRENEELFKWLSGDRSGRVGSRNSQHACKVCQRSASLARTSRAQLHLALVALVRAITRNPLFARTRRLRNRRSRKTGGGHAGASDYGLLLRSRNHERARQTLMARARRQ